MSDQPVKDPGEIGAAPNVAGGFGHSEVSELPPWRGSREEAAQEMAGKREQLRLWQITVWPFGAEQIFDDEIEEQLGRTYTVAAPNEDMAAAEAQRMYHEELTLKTRLELIEPLIVERLSAHATRTTEAKDMPRWWERLFR